MTISGHAGELRYRSAPRRREEILRRMRGTGYVSAPDLSADLAVSERTVRRDLQKLAELGLAELIYGGALAPGGVPVGSPFGDRSQERSAHKRAIARHALRFVTAGASIGIDAGTTTLELARLLPAAEPTAGAGGASGGPGVTVVTHSLPVMGALGEQPETTLIGLGGLHHQTTRTFTGPDTVAAISRLRVHTFFLAAGALGRHGTYSNSPFDVETKRAFMDIADRVVLLADSSKLRQTAPMPICDYARLDAIVTDSGLGAADRARLGARTELLVASPEQAP